VARAVVTIGAIGMTDRHSAYIVTLANDIREDDAREIITALRMVKNVVSVEPVVTDYPLSVATRRVQAELREKLRDVLSK
jgi:hypothetical protein